MESLWIFSVKSGTILFKIPAFAGTWCVVDTDPSLWSSCCALSDLLSKLVFNLNVLVDIKLLTEVLENGGIRRRFIQHILCLRCLDIINSKCLMVPSSAIYIRI